MLLDNKRILNAREIVRDKSYLPTTYIHFPTHPLPSYLSQYRDGVLLEVEYWTGLDWGSFRLLMLQTLLIRQGVEIQHIKGLIKGCVVELNFSEEIRRKWKKAVLRLQIQVTEFVS